MLWPNGQYTKLQIRRSEVKPKLDQWVVFLGKALLSERDSLCGGPSISTSKLSGILDKMLGEAFAGLLSFQAPHQCSFLKLCKLKEVSRADC